MYRDVDREWERRHISIAELRAQGRRETMQNFNKSQKSGISG